MMASAWPRPERLLPPKLLDAVDAAHSGEAERALRLVSARDRSDPLTADVVRLVQGLAARERGDSAEALRLLRPLLRADDPALRLSAALTCTALQITARGFALPAPWLLRARRWATDTATALVLDAALLELELRRRGSLPSASVTQLQNRLRRTHPAPVHAVVHLLAAEQALYAGDHEAAQRAERLARPYVASAHSAELRRRHAEIDALLNGAPLAEVEDWERPARPMTRSEIAALTLEPWQLWVDGLHARVLHRSRQREAATVIPFASHPEAWALLTALLSAPRRTLTWSAARQSLGQADEGATRQLAARLQQQLERGGATHIVRVNPRGCALVPKRFVHLHPVASIPRSRQRVLAFLAERPGAGAAELGDRLGMQQRTLRRHLQALCAQGLVRRVGGGRETRYLAI